MMIQKVVCQIIILLVAVMGTALSQCPGEILGVATKTARTCAAATELAREAAILDADSECPDNCIFVTTPIRVYDYPPVIQDSSCTVTVAVLHVCRSVRHEPEGEPTGDPETPILLKIVAGAAAVALGTCAVFLLFDPVPGDEVVAAGLAAELAAVAGF